MDFVERLFGISPDGGSGTTEAVVFIILTMAVVVVLGKLRRRFSITGKQL
jgi:hypothetical protein